MPVQRYRDGSATLAGGGSLGGDGPAGIGSRLWNGVKAYVLPTAEAGQAAEASLRRLPGGSALPGGKRNIGLNP